jgi:hypothetical protein
VPRIATLFWALELKILHRVCAFISSALSEEPFWWTYRLVGFFSLLPLGSLPDCFELLQKFENKECVARRRGALFCKPVLQEYFVLL